MGEMSIKKIHPFNCLQAIETERDYFLRDSKITTTQIKLLKLEFKFLDIFLRLQSFINVYDNLDVIQQVQTLFEDAVVDLKEVYLNPHRNCDLIYQVESKTWIVKSNIRAKYSFQLMSFDMDGVATDPKIAREFMDDVVWILGNLVEIDDPQSLLYVPESKEQIKEVLKELKLLMFFVCFVSNKGIEPQIQHAFFSHVLIVAGHAAMVAWLYLPSHDNENQDLAPTEINALLSHLLQMKIKPIQPSIRKIYIDVLQALKSTTQPRWHPNEHAAEADTGNLVEVELSTVSKMATLQEMLNLLRVNLIHLPILDLEFHLQDMDTVIIDAGLLIYSLYDDEGEKEDMMLADVNGALGLDLPSNVQPINAMIYHIIRKAFQSNLPMIHGLGYVDFLLNNLKEFQARYENSLASFNNQLQIIQEKLESLQPFLEDVAEDQKHMISTPETRQDCVTALICIAYEVEYVVDACISKDVPHWCLERWLLDIIQEITLIKSEIAEIQEKKLSSPILDNTMNVSTKLAETPRMTEKFVGHEDARKELRNKLIKGSANLDVISIFGMPGQGKTTLAQRLYYDESVIEHFDIRAQCCVSQVYKRMDLLLAILHGATGKSCSSSTEDDVANELWRTLQRKRYLILIDDVWEKSAWDDLVCCFKDDKVGSRIILTTRHREIAEYATLVSGPFHLRRFTDDESWDLLKSKVIGEESCSPPLEEVGRQLAIKCGGLPLSIVLVAGILAKEEKREQSWNQVATSLVSHIRDDSKAIIELSYKALSYHLKPCFIYFGTFFEDSMINVPKLTRLWISEGFIKSCEGKKPEDIAQGYLENLIGRNLVMDVVRSSTGKVKACRIHDLLHDFCKERAKEKRLLLWIERDQNVNPSSCIYFHKQHAQRRLAFCKVDDLEEWSSSCSLVGSVLSRIDRGISREYFAIPNIFHNFRFMKVLDLEGIVIDCFPTELVYLRYFAAKFIQDSVSLSTVNLWNLETLILDFGREIPSLWKLIKLRHLHTFYSLDINNGDELLEDSSILYDLETLSCPYFSCVEVAKLVLRKTPNIRGLKCRIPNVSSGPFPVLDFPTSLETLHIHGTGILEEDRRDFPRTRFMFPLYISASNLKKLRIRNSRMDFQHLSSIAQLQNLRVLKLKYVEFVDDKWEVSNDEFSQLKVLKIDWCTNLREWTVSDDAFPQLEHLVLSGLRWLMDIPSCFEDKPSLMSIKLKYYTDSLVRSAEIIQKTQAEMQNSGFKLFLV